MAGEKDLATRLKEWLSEVSTSKFLTMFEPERSSLRDVRIGQARYISSRLQKAPDDSFVQFPDRYGRHTTLAGIWMFLARDHEREYLVTAFGRRQGKAVNRPAQFEGLHVSLGNEYSVRFSPTNLDYLQKHIDKVRDAEVLICHNHPRNFLSDLLSPVIDWSPLPSKIDRETMYRFKYDVIVRWLASGNFQNMRFYLVEAGELREILLPPIDRIAAMLRAVVWTANSAGWRGP